MNKSQREIYVELASEMDSPVCCFCKFSTVEVGNSPCDCGEPYCSHPLDGRLEEQWGDYMRGAEPGDDCWGFRPAHPVDFCADIVGLNLANGWLSAIWWQSKSGKWKVAEVKL